MRYILIFSIECGKIKSAKTYKNYPLWLDKIKKRGMLYGHVHNTFDEYIVNEHMKQVGKYKRTVRESLEQIGIPSLRIKHIYMNGDLRYAFFGKVDLRMEKTVDETKRDIVDLYEEGFTKIDASGLAGDIYDAIPANLSGNASRYVLSSAREGARSGRVRGLLPRETICFITRWKVIHQIIYMK